MILLAILIPALIVFANINFTSKNNKKLTPIKVPVTRRKF